MIALTVGVVFSLNSFSYYLHLLISISSSVLGYHTGLCCIVPLIEGPYTHPWQPVQGRLWVRVASARRWHHKVKVTESWRRRVLRTNPLSSVRLSELNCRWEVSVTSPPLFQKWTHPRQSYMSTKLELSPTPLIPCCHTVMMIPCFMPESSVSELAKKAKTKKSLFFKTLRISLTGTEVGVKVTLSVTHASMLLDMGADLSLCVL